MQVECVMDLTLRITIRDLMHYFITPGDVLHTELYRNTYQLFLLCTRLLSSSLVPERQKQCWPPVTRNKKKDFSTDCSVTSVVTALDFQILICEFIFTDTPCVHHQQKPLLCWVKDFIIPWLQDTTVSSFSWYETLEILRLFGVDTSDISVCQHCTGVVWSQPMWDASRTQMYLKCMFMNSWCCWGIFPNGHMVTCLLHKD